MSNFGNFQRKNSNETSVSGFGAKIQILNFQVIFVILMDFDSLEKQDNFEIYF